MGKLALAILVFGLAVPFAIHWLDRRIGIKRLLALSVAAGLAYGALKADIPWSGQGLSKNLALMLVSALALAAYAALSLGAAKLVAKAIPSLPR